MGSVNKVILVGNLGKDAELRFTGGGTPVTTLRLATTDARDKDKDGKPRTEWHTVVVWGKTAESLATYLVKGKQIYVEGRLQTREWDGKDGQKRSVVEVVAERVQFMGGGRARGDGAKADGGAAREPAAVRDGGGGDGNDDVPF